MQHYLEEGTGRGIPLRRHNNNNIYIYIYNVEILTSYLSVLTTK